MKNKEKFPIALIAMIILIVSILVIYKNETPIRQVLFGSTYYVNPLGNDLDPGTAEMPFKTLPKAVSVLTAGDTLVVSGVYNTFLIPASKVGTEIAPIKFIGHNALIDGKGVSAKGIEMRGQYLVVSGFEVVNVRQHAIWNVGQHNVIENNIVHDNVTENGTNGNCTLIPGGGWGSAIALKLGSDDIAVRNNTVYHNCGEGIGAGRTKNMLIENNLVYDNYSINLYINGSFFVTVRNNIVNCTDYVHRDGRRSMGVVMAAEIYSGWGLQLHDVDVRDNTVDGCYNDIRISRPEMGGTIINILVDNNYLSSGTSYAIINRADAQNVVISNNRMHNGGMSINPSAGVTLINNTVSVTVTPVTVTPAITKTPTLTKTPRSPTVTKTPRTPTVTKTPRPPTQTPRPTRTPTLTRTPRPPTQTPRPTRTPTITRTPTP